jgi:chromosome partitioning protein
MSEANFFRVKEQMNIISIVNQKGGTGKTTTAINLGASLVNLGKKVLLIDADPQANLTTRIGIMGKDKTIYDCLVNNVPVNNCIYKTNIKNFKTLKALYAKHFKS